MTDQGKVVQTVVTTETTTEYDTNDSSFYSDLHLIISDVIILVGIGLSLSVIFSKKPN